LPATCVAVVVDGGCFIAAVAFAGKGKIFSIPFSSLARSSYFCRVFAVLGLLRSFGALSLDGSVELLSN
jgi:hypothetical protein